MQIQKVQNNNTSFGVKLVIGKSMYPKGNIFDGGEKELLQKLVSKVESQTADKKGILYVSDSGKDLYNKNNLDIYYKSGKYIDHVILYDKAEQNLLDDTDKYADTLVRITDVFVMRKNAVKTAQNIQKQIEKLEQKVHATMYELCENIKNTLPERKAFSGSMFDIKQDFESNEIFGKLYKEAGKIQKNILA